MTRRSLWDKIDEADGLEAGSERTQRLREALAEIDSLELDLGVDAGAEQKDRLNEACISERDLSEARAVALAMLAYEDQSLLLAAAEACAAATDAGGSRSLPYAHLAEALLKHQRNAEALDACAQVEAERLESEDLHWRVVRIDQIRGAALIRLSRLAEAELVINRVFRELSNEDAHDFLPVPNEIVEALIDRARHAEDVEAAEALRLIQQILKRLDVDAWFPPQTRETLRELPTISSGKSVPKSCN